MFKYIQMFAKYLSINANSSTDSKKILLVRKICLKKLFLRGDFTPFMSKSFQI